MVAKTAAMALHSRAPTTMTVSRLAQYSRKYFNPASHQWYRLIEHHNRHHIRLQVGLTQRGLDHIGEITAVVPIQGRVGIGMPLVRIDWEGFARTESDELYHAIWESIAGSQVLEAPLEGEVVAVADAGVEIDDETPIVELACEQGAVELAVDSWVTDVEYAMMTSRQEKGVFAEAF